MIHIIIELKEIEEGVHVDAHSHSSNPTEEERVISYEILKFLMSNINEGKANKAFVVQHKTE